jgi:hypothetical protein
VSSCSHPLCLGPLQRGHARLALLAKARIKTAEDAAGKLPQQNPVKVEPKFPRQPALGFDKVRFPSVSSQVIAKLGSRCEPGAVAPLYSTLSVESQTLFVIDVKL